MPSFVPLARNALRSAPVVVRLNWNPPLLQSWKPELIPNLPTSLKLSTEKPVPADVPNVTTVPQVLGLDPQSING